jgi:hypothetical protein
MSPEVYAAFDAICRVTKPGGLVVIGVPGFRAVGPRHIAPPRVIGWARKPRAPGDSPCE